MKLIVKIGENTAFPAWYYGLAYNKFHRRVQVFMIIPLNYIVRFLRLISVKWDKFRCRPGIVDRMVLKIIQAGREGAKRGFMEDTAEGKAMGAPKRWRDELDKKYGFKSGECKKNNNAIQGDCEAKEYE